jgi:hypothetical protein
MFRHWAVAGRLEGARMSRRNSRGEELGPAQFDDRSYDDRQLEGVLPSAVWSGEFVLFGVPLKCHVLNDGRRIIDAESIEDLMRAMATQGEQSLEEMEREVAAFARWMRGK